MAFACSFDFEAKKKSEVRSLEFETTDGLKWCIEERWQIVKNSNPKGALGSSRNENECSQKISFFVMQQEFLAEDRYFVEIHFFDPQNPLLGSITREQALHLNRVVEVPLTEYDSKFAVTCFAHPPSLRCCMNFFPLYHPEFIPCVSLKPSGTVVPVKQIETKKALEKFLSMAKSVQESECLSDVLITCDSAKFRASRNVLAARSAVFAKIFENPRNRNSVFISGIEPRVFQELLSFLHTGNMLLKDSADIVSLFDAADLYKIEDLKDICASHLDHLETCMLIDPPPIVVEDRDENEDSDNDSMPAGHGGSEEQGPADTPATIVHSDILIKQEKVDISKVVEDTTKASKSTPVQLIKQEPVDTDKTADCNRLIKAELPESPITASCNKTLEQNTIEPIPTTSKNVSLKRELPDDSE